MVETIKPRSTPRARAAAVADVSVAREAEDLDRSLLEEGAELGAAMLAVVQDNATAFYHEQRDRAASEIGSLGELLHNSVRSMQQREGVVARCTDEAASQIEGFADWLRGRSWNELTGDVGDLARRYPLSFLTAVAGAGFLAVRLFAASGEPADEQEAWTAGENDPSRATMPLEAEVVAGITGGEAAEHDGGATGGG